MIACFAWTNSQILNIANAKINIYSDEHADLYIRMGNQISVDLIESIRAEGIFDNVFCLELIKIDPRTLPFGRIKFVRGLFYKGAFKKEYKAVLDRLCPGKKYDRVITSWFYNENVFLIDYWAKNSGKLPITFIDEGTGSYCLTKKGMLYPLSLIKGLKNKLKRKLSEGGMARRFAANVDSICLYQPDCCRPDIDYVKHKLPQITKETNPVMHRILCRSFCLGDDHLERYNKSECICFSTYSPIGESFDNTSLELLDSAIKCAGSSGVIAKIHTGFSSHMNGFALGYEDRIYVDRNKYLFEGMYAQLDAPEDKLLLSCMSSASVTPKFVFDKEPYVILLFRLYEGYQKHGVERDDWMASKLVASYRDKSRVMIPGSMEEYEEMLALTLKKMRNGASAET